MNESKPFTAANLTKLGSDLARMDAHVITAEEYEEIPELTEEDFARAELRIGGKLVRRGRPRSDNAKVAVKLRLSPEVLAHFKAGGPGWQTRIDAALRGAVRRAEERGEG